MLLFPVAPQFSQSTLQPLVTSWWLHERSCPAWRPKTQKWATNTTGTPQFCERRVTLPLLASYMFHCLVHEGITYMCMADKDFSRRVAYAFLDDTKGRFQRSYGDRAHNALAFAMNDDFSRVLNKQMVYWSSPFLLNLWQSLTSWFLPILL